MEKRFYTLLIIMSLIFIMIMIGALIDEAKAAKYVGELETYTVMPGETLWDIAEDIESDMDIREIIYWIKKDNGLKDSSISAWQELKIRESY